MTIALSLAAVAAAETRQIAPGRLTANAADDFTMMWWTHGVRAEPKLFSIQTSRYALTFDADKLEFASLIPGTTAAGEAAALTQDNRTVLAGPSAELSFGVEVAGQRYQVTGGSGRQDDCMLIEGGRFLQRRLLDSLCWSKGAPVARGQLEIAAWPDRLLLLFRVASQTDWPDTVVDLSLKLDGIYDQPFGKGPGLGLKAGDGTGFVIVPFSKSASLSYDAKKGSVTARVSTSRLPAGSEATAALVIYPITRGNDDVFAQIVEGEMEPVKIVATQIAPEAAGLLVNYDRALGWHEVRLRNDGKDRDPETGPNDRIERVRLTVANPSTQPKVVRFNFAKDKSTPGGVMGVFGNTSLLRDADGYPLGLPVQLSFNAHDRTKHWTTMRPEQSDRYERSWMHHISMFTMPPQSGLVLEYTAATCRWGGVPPATHAQLCLIGWGYNQLWEVATLGSWFESICFEPDHTQTGGSVLDTRPLLTYPQQGGNRRKWTPTCNVGGADFLRGPEHIRVKTRRVRSGPVLTETTYAGQTKDESIDLQYTVSLYRTDDIVRGVYHFRYDVRKAVAFDRLVWFQCGGDDYNYTRERKMALGNENGLIKEWNTQWGGNVYRTKPMEATGRVRWVSLHDAVPMKVGDATANRGLVIREWQAIVGGKSVGPWVAERGAKVRDSDTSLIDLLPPPEVKQFRPGDHVECVIEHIVMPQWARDYYGPNKNLAAALAKDENTWRMIQREALGNNLDVIVTTGQLARKRPLLIEAVNNRAEFSIAGGLGYVPVTIAGLTAYRSPVLEVSEQGIWKTVNQEVNGKDFWQCDLDPSERTWQITYSVNSDTPSDMRTRRSYRFMCGN